MYYTQCIKEKKRSRNSRTIIKRTLIEFNEFNFWKHERAQLLIILMISFLYHNKKKLSNNI